MQHRSKRLLDRVRDAIRLKGYSVRIEQAYVTESSASFSSTINATHNQQSAYYLLSI